MENKKINKYFIIGTAVLVLFIIGLFASEKNKKEVGKKDTVSISDTASPVVSELPKVENWQYGEEKDKMTDKDMFFANCTSTNSVDFKFPYDGGSSLRIIVRKMNGKNDVILKITKGQFVGSYNETVDIKFDDEQAKSYSYVEPTDGSHDYIFINSSSSLIAKLKKAKAVKIQPQFFQEGPSVFEFNVEGLKWEH